MKKDYKIRSILDFDHTAPSNFEKMDYVTTLTDPTGYISTAEYFERALKGQAIASVNNSEAYEFGEDVPYDATDDIETSISHHTDDLDLADMYEMAEESAPLIKKIKARKETARVQAIKQQAIEEYKKQLEEQTQSKSS